jgi:DNA-directed RNA polymerase subunit omega
MARITVEDCEKVVANRFDLVILAALRTRQIMNGDPITVESKNDKKSIIALREIAARSVSVEALKAESVKGFRVFTPQEDLDEDIEDLPEEDTYNPYAGIEAASLKSDHIPIVDSVEPEGAMEPEESEGASDAETDN